MAKKQLTIREQAQLLVQSILAKDALSANKIFGKLIAEAEQEREKYINGIILEQDDLDDDLGDDEGGDDAGDDLGDDEGGDDTGDDTEGGDDAEGEEQGADEAQVDGKIDDALQIQCQINAKRISSMFDTIAQLKQALDDKGLDPNSKQFIKSDVSITYYSDKLQEFQGKTNPGVDQSKLEQALDKIFESLEELKSDIGVQGGSDVDTDIETPDETGQDLEGSEGEEGQEESEGQEDLEEGQEDLEGEEGQEDLGEEQQELE